MTGADLAGLRASHGEVAIGDFAEHFQHGAGIRLLFGLEAEDMHDEGAPRLI